MAIGHTRLSIVDTTKNANQPFRNSSAVLAYNGELYNHHSLRSTFLQHERFSSYSDTETLFKLVLLLGVTKALAKIQGMYAFSFLDLHSRSLHLCSDAFSIKPLYYINAPDYFAWSSEIKAFEALPNFRFEINKKVLEEHLIFRSIAGKETLFRKVHKLLPGEHLIFHTKNLSIQRKKQSFIKKGASNKASLDTILQESVRDHLMSDAQVGIQLSGGIDSSLVAFFAQNISRQKLHTFSIGLKDRNWNEFKYSGVVAKTLGTKHHKLFFSKKSFTALLPRMTYMLDGPIVHPNTIPMHILASHARKYTKVLLAGEGADELFLGYRRYENQYNSDTEILYSNAFASQKLVSSLLKNKNEAFLKERKKILHEARKMNDADKISLYDIKTYLPHVLSRQDRAGMSANIENRVPFLYPPIVEKGAFKKGNVGIFGGKTPIKEIALQYFKEDFVLRTKCGFGLPISQWMKERDALLPLIEKLHEHPLIKKYFWANKVKLLTKQHISSTCDNSPILFTLLALTLWYDVFFTDPSSTRRSFLSQFSMESELPIEEVS